jgi:RHS repeat-associated protein
VRSGTNSYFLQDGLGSVTSLSNSAGALANTYSYDSFGQRTAFMGTLTNPFQYTGRELDSETSLCYYRARYYDPQNGRFISEDPIQFQGGSNIHAYVRNDPVRLADPSGLKGCCKSHECPGRACYIDNCTSLNGLGGTAVQGFDCQGDKDCCIDEFKVFAAKCKARNVPGYPTKYKANYDPGAWGSVSGQCCQLYQ